MESELMQLQEKIASLEKKLTNNGSNNTMNALQRTQKTEVKDDKVNDSRLEINLDKHTIFEDPVLSEQPCVDTSRHEQSFNSELNSDLKQKKPKRRSESVAVIASNKKVRNVNSLAQAKGNIIRNTDRPVSQPKNQPLRTRDASQKENRPLNTSKEIKS